MELNTFPESVYYYYKEWQEYNMNIHKHPAIEIMYVIKGKCKVEIDNQIVELRKNQYIFIHSNVPHRLIVEKKYPCRMLNVEFEWRKDRNHFTNVHTLMKHDERLMEMFLDDENYFVLKDVDNVYNHLRSLVLELDHKVPGNELIIDILLIQLLTSVAKNRTDQKEHINEANEYFINQVLAFIHENYDYEIKVQDLAKVVHLHPSYLHRIFKQTMKITINEYITKVRIDKAKMLLVNTDIPVTEISNYVGINTSQYFSNIFKKYTGLSPSKYREYFQDFKS
ncbi:helix-turn-helix domain-containing protein [Gracilibacillus salitolerans]|uniref:Helix-turn-helix domain-containing protein n=1 Tax=Gracilibacillus salitolerans TaxID=2663022 RepID=A0A5Q2TPW7_9BACI|nr:AraC family transcriptional regulator [Gracilibacillus salitolerans]QGH36221.1 helix-turn-helix domain-containing protein [Gracilibacillus salitolerans]